MTRAQVLFDDHGVAWSWPRRRGRCDRKSEPHVPTFGPVLREAPELMALDRDVFFPVGAGLTGHVCATGETLWVEDLGQPAPFPRMELAARRGLTSMVVIPVRGVRECLGHAIWGVSIAGLLLQPSLQLIPAAGQGHLLRLQGMQFFQYFFAHCHHYSLPRPGPD